MSQTDSIPTTMTTTPSIDDVRDHVATARHAGQQIGVVPTMGALHAGHMSLIETARRECDYVVVTIFVNPTQFGPDEDFGEYPRPIGTDLELCREAGVDLIFQPETDTMYVADSATFVEVEGLSSVLEGHHRPGHFRGVTTVVIKLLNIVQADVAYFGRKDYQQQLVIRRMCDDLCLPIEIRTCPTVRESDGLALSSRNRYLSDSERQSALALSQCLELAETRLRNGETDVTAVRHGMRELLEQTPLVTADYATVADPTSLEELRAPRHTMVALVAARVGTTRLIDNLPIDLHG